MELYAIIRRNGWRTGGDLEEAAARSSRVGDEEMAEDIRWIRSYVLAEGGTTVGTVCIYQGRDADAIRRHAREADMACDEVIPVADTFVVRPDPIATAV
jgi:hypothetical protein